MDNKLFRKVGALEYVFQVLPWLTTFIIQKQIRVDNKSFVPHIPSLSWQ